MKPSAAKLKGLDFKQIAIDHGEKAVLGLVGVFVLLVMWGARWASYQEKTPEDLIQQVARAGEDLEKSTWPDTEKAAFPTDKDLQADIRSMRDPVRLDLYAYGPGTGMFWQFYKEEQKVREPDGVWLTVESPKADALRILMATQDENGAADALAMADDDPEAEADDDPALAAFRRPGAGGRFGGAPGFEDPAAGDGYERGMPRGGPPGRRRGFDSGGAEAFAGDMGMGMDGEGMYGYGAGAGVSAEGRRLVSVRGVYHLRRQADRLYSARGEPKGTDPLDLVDIEDFEIERQQAVRGPEGFGEWVRLDPATAIRLLMEEAADWDDDVVDSGITDAIITCPLPQRLMEYWADEASHPEVKNFLITTPEGRELQRLIDEKLTEYEQQLAERPKPGGFGAVQIGVGNVRRGFGTGRLGTGSRPGRSGSRGMYGSAGMEDYGMMADDLFGRGMNFEQQYGIKVDRNALARQLRDTISAAGTLLLFRYLDFDVEPGHAYRYRMRLKLRNPNYGLPLDKVERPEVAEGESRWSPWSEPTPVVAVPRDTEYFLAETRGSTLRNPPEAALRMFQWLQDAGTISDAEVKVTPGQTLGGVVETYVLRPAKPSFEKEKDITISDDDVLVDVADLPRTLGPGHEELQLPSSARCRLGLPEVALAVNEFGELVTLDPVSRKRTLERLEKRQESERYYYQDLKDKDTKATQYDDLGGLMEYGEGYAEEGMYMEEDTRRRRRGKNPIRRSGMMEP